MEKFLLFFLFFHWVNFSHVGIKSKVSIKTYFGFFLVANNTMILKRFDIIRRFVYHFLTSITFVDVGVKMSSANLIYTLSRSDYNNFSYSFFNKCKLIMVYFNRYSILTKLIKCYFRTKYTLNSFYEKLVSTIVITLGRMYKYNCNYITIV